MTKLIDIAFEKMHYDAMLPAYDTSGSAGMDIRAFVDHPCGQISIAPGERHLVDTGIRLSSMPEGYELQVRPRSGMAFKWGLTVLNSPGTIDSDYRDEIKILLHNTGKHDFRIKHGDRIAQLVIAEVTQARINGTPPPQKKRDGGFGSTGVA